MSKLHVIYRWDFSIEVDFSEVYSNLIVKFRSAEVLQQ